MLKREIQLQFLPTDGQPRAAADEPQASVLETIQRRDDGVVDPVCLTETPN
jgi:hypothetical protein